MASKFICTFFVLIASFAIVSKATPLLYLNDNYADASGYYQQFSSPVNVINNVQNTPFANNIPVNYVNTFASANNNIGFIPYSGISTVNYPIVASPAAYQYLQPQGIPYSNSQISNLQNAPVEVNFRR